MLKIIKSIGITNVVIISILLTLVITYLTTTALFYTFFKEVQTGEILISLLIPSILISILLPKLIYKSFALYNAQEKAKAIEGCDRVTGFYTKHYFLTLLRREMSSVKRYGYELCIMSLRIKNFSEIEHTHGRHTSEYVLKEISDRLNTSFRKSDILSRYSEDTFMFIIPHTKEENCTIVLERVKESVEGTPVFHLDKIEIQAEIKTETLLEEDDTEDSLLNRLESN